MSAPIDEVYARQGFGGGFQQIAPVALLLVDFCNAFVDPAQLGSPHIAAAAERSTALLAHARANGWPVAHSQIVFDASDRADNAWFEKVPALQDLMAGQACVDFIASLQPQAGEFVVRKKVPSAFFASGLAEWLAGHGVRGLVIAGCTTSGCVRASAVDALSHGLRPVVVADCVADRSWPAHEASLMDLAAKYAAVMELPALLQQLAFQPIP